MGGGARVLAVLVARLTYQDGDGLREADGVAEVVAERPVLEQQRGDERERDAEERHEQVADGHVHDEQVGDGVHLRGEHDHVAHQPVADQRHDEHGRVHEVDDGLERGRAQRAAVVLVARPGVRQAGGRRRRPVAGDVRPPPTLGAAAATAGRGHLPPPPVQRLSSVTRRSPSSRGPASKKRSVIRDAIFMYLLILKYRL